MPIWCVTIGVEDASGLVAGAVLDPLRGELYRTWRGGGAWLGDRRLQVSACTQLGEALLVTGFPYDVHTQAGPILDLFGAFTVRAQGIRRLGSAALDLAYVASGRLDGFWEGSLKSWDMAAGVLLVQEAGGIATALTGGGPALAGGSALAAPPALHAAMRAVVDGAAR
ncbi:MAG: inositol monophosphatase family protein [Anaeromyxobacter sp.]